MGIGYVGFSLVGLCLGRIYTLIEMGKAATELTGPRRAENAADVPSALVVTLCGLATFAEGRRSKSANCSCRSYPALVATPSW